MKKLIIAGVIAIAAFSLTGCQNLVQNEPVVCTVVDKDRSTESSKNGSKSVFRIYTENCGEDNETLGLADNILQGNLRSSDMYAKIKVGETYRFETVGIRNGAFSSFREIVRFTKVSAPVPGMTEPAK